MKVSRLFWIGMVFVISSIAFVGGLMYLQEMTFRKSNYTFIVLFDNVQGLHVGDQVDMLGKKIGKVSKSRIMGQKIAVELSIDNSFAFSIPVDSKIEVKSAFILIPSANFEPKPTPKEIIPSISLDENDSVSLFIPSRPIILSVPDLRIASPTPAFGGRRLA